VFAQSETDSVRHLREVTVTRDAKLNQSRSTSPLQVIYNEKLATLNALQISDAVKHFSGVTVKDYGGIGGLKTVSVRSLGANHTVVSYDGIPVSDVQTGQIDIGRFSLENVDNISLSIGQSNNIFQPARMLASASVLNIQSQKPTLAENQFIAGKVGVKAGSFGMFNPTFLLNGKFSNIVSASLSGEWLSAHGKYPYILNYGVIGKDSSSLETRKNTDVKNLRLEGTVFTDFSPNSRGYLKGYFYNSERGLPGATIYYNTDNFYRNEFGTITYLYKLILRVSFRLAWIFRQTPNTTMLPCDTLTPPYLILTESLKTTTHSKSFMRRAQPYTDFLRSSHFQHRQTLFLTRLMLI